MRLYLIALSLLLQSLHCVAEPYSVQSYTRETDYTIGSVARQHLVIEVPPGYQLDEGSLPEKGVTEAVELRNIHWQSIEANKQTRYTFEIDWQIFVASEAVKSIPLRSLELIFSRDGKALTVTVPADTVLVSSLLPPKMDAKHVQPYPDVLPVKIETMPFVSILVLALCMLLSACSYIAWYFGWISLPAEKSMPFRQAWRAIGKLPADANAASKALQLMSHAFNQYAGYTVTAENLSLLFTQHVAIQAYAKEAEQFYQDIQHTFFAGTAPRHSLNAIKKLAKQLSRLELS